MRTKSVTKENIAPGIVCTAPWRLTKVKPLPNYELEVEFNDGAHGFVEMVKLIMSVPTLYRWIPASNNFNGNSDS